MSRGRLSPLQDEVLDAFFALERGFFLTGGAALCGFHLAHRETSDLDLFSFDDDATRRGERVLARVAADRGLVYALRRTAPDFARATLSRGDAQVVVDLVRARVAALHIDKPEHGAIRVDPLDEILVNKLNMLVARQEERDVVDVMFIERRGLRVEDFMAAALAKDGGCTPANVAWLLSSWAAQIPDDAQLVAGVSGAELRAYMEALVVRMRRVALPAP